MSRNLRVFAVASVVVVLLIAASYVAWPHFFQSKTDKPGAGTDGAEDPRLTYKTPFQNVRPDVKYVGDAACKECHREISQKYSQHPMGRSFGLSADQVAMEPRGSAAHNPFEKFGE